MKIHKLAILGSLTGLAVIVCSIIQWFFLWKDYSQMSLGVSIGLIICGFSYIYNWMREKDIAIDKQNETFEAFRKWWAKEELK